MNKTTRTILCVCTALYVGLVVWTIAERNTAQREAERIKFQYNEVCTLSHKYKSERDNALELAKQYKSEYQQAVFEIAELKAQNEELRHAFEETSFALDEVCFETGGKDLGYFNITFYCNCDSCCGKYADGITATGTIAEEGRTVAVDPSIIPLGSKVKIDGHVYIAEDTGVRGKVIDVFVDSHERALQLGTKIEVVKAIG